MGRRRDEGDVGGGCVFMQRWAGRGSVHVDDDAYGDWSGAALSSNKMQRDRSLLEHDYRASCITEAKWSAVVEADCVWRPEKKYDRSRMQLLYFRFFQYGRECTHYPLLLGVLPRIRSLFTALSYSVIQRAPALCWHHIRRLPDKRNETRRMQRRGARCAPAQRAPAQCAPSRASDKPSVSLMQCNTGGMAGRPHPFSVCALQQECDSICRYTLDTQRSFIRGACRCPMCTATLTESVFCCAHGGV